MLNKTKLNFWLDVFMFVVMLIATITGLLLWLVIPHKFDIIFLGLSRAEWISTHIYSGLSGLVGIVIHIVWHRNWLKALRGRSIRGLPDKVRANRIVNRVMWLNFIAAVVFGAAAWVIHFNKSNNFVSSIDRFHVVFAVTSVMSVIVHLVFHRKWISFTARSLQTMQKPIYQQGIIASGSNNASVH